MSTFVKRVQKKLAHWSGSENDTLQSRGYPWCRKDNAAELFVGEKQSSNLGLCKFYTHQNLRIAYVAQHAFHHVEQHTQDSPVFYIQWRFNDRWDKENNDSVAFHIDDKDQRAFDEFQLEGIWCRNVCAGYVEYEVHKRNTREKENRYYTREELLAMGVEHLLKQTDKKIASEEAGLDLRPVTMTEIQKHLDDFDLIQEFGT